MKKADPKWKRFEKTVYELQKQLAPDCEVKFNDSITGVRSKTRRQIDISIRRRVGPYSILVIIECKDRKPPVDINIMGEFASRLEDVRANKGAMISSSGFTPACIEFAKAHGIDTLMLFDTESVDWRSYASLPFLLELVNLKRFRIIFESFSRLPSIVQSTDPRFLNLFTSDGKVLGSVRKIITQKWKNNEIDESPGEKDVLIGRGLVLEFGGQKISLIGVGARVYIEKSYYLSKLPVHLRGVQDLQSGDVITREIRTDTIDVVGIHNGQVKGWEKISSPDVLSIKPLSVKVRMDPIEETNSTEENH